MADKEKKGKMKSPRWGSQKPKEAELCRILEEVQSNGQAIATEFGTVQFVDKKKGIEAKDYYHGLLPSEDMRHLLTQNGDYCVRTTEIKSEVLVRDVAGQDSSLSSLHDSKYSRMTQYQNNPKLKQHMDVGPAIDKTPQFGSLDCLIDFYADRKEPFSQFQMSTVHANTETCMGGNSATHRSNWNPNWEKVLLAKFIWDM
uniref:SH2 domain-containing protein n=1 Tax=Ditylenchus dipsaci TaxID=166011 RepID=A0A915D5X2_9BILA